MTSPTPEAYTVLWTAERCNWLVKWGDVGKCLEVVFGGTLLSAPSFTRFKVKVGDYIYPVRVHQQQLYVIAQLRVDRIISLEEYLDKDLLLPQKLLQMHLWDLEARLWEERPDLGHRLPYNCIFEAATGEGTPIQLHCAVPSEMLESIRFTSQRGERQLKYIKDGKLVRSVSLQGGFYRLSSASAADFRTLTETR